MRSACLLLHLFFAALALSCDKDSLKTDLPSSPAEDSYVWKLPSGFPKPKVPADNPMNTAKVELGRRLFYDRRLSGNGTYSCGSCHEQKRAFTDGRGVALGSTGEVHPRGSMSLANVGYAAALTWANPLVTTLEKQALTPMFGEAPVELGLAGKEEELLERLRREPLYQKLFPEAFPEVGGTINLDTITKAIAAFERTLISGNSPYDRYLAGDQGAMSESALRGKELFFSERLECFHCHGGFLLADSVTHDGKVMDEVMFHNTGLYNIDGQGGYPAPNRGVLEISNRPEDMGRFKAPTLRNIAVTGPYMHDGSIATLSEVIDHYAAGGRTIATGPYAGDGSKNPYKSEFVTGFLLTPQEKLDLIAFLESLTDTDFLVDPDFSDPWLSAP
ncbi:MAG: di-heme enzyme [Myxococcales bacterium]|nr:di-heme enzyme [Myxococcales bacterium]